MNKNNEYTIPKFNNIEEEDEFWKSHSPLMEGYKGKVQRKKQNRASFLSIRLNDKELAQLREEAIKQRLGPSTYARQLIVQQLESDLESLPPDILHVLSKCDVVLDNKTNPDQRENYEIELQRLYKNYLKVANDMQRLFPFLANVPQIAEKREEYQR